MEKTILKLIGSYFNWTKNNCKIIPTDSQWFVIQTPFTDVSNDIIEIYIRILSDGNIELSDDSNTLTNLKLRQYELTNEKIENIQKNILNSYGIQIINGDELYFICDQNEFSSSLNNIIQAIIQIDSLYLYKFI